MDRKKKKTEKPEKQRQTKVRKIAISISMPTINYFIRNQGVTRIGLRSYSFEKREVHHHNNTFKPNLAHNSIGIIRPEFH